MSVSVIGQEAGIEHGTPKGYRQHKYRGVPACRPCLDAIGESNAQGRQAKREGRPPAARPRKTAKASQAWNGGMTGTPEPLPPRPLTGECSVSGCGVKTVDTGRPGPDMVTVAVPGSREPARWYCPGWCATYGQALAEIRAIPETEGG